MTTNIVSGGGGGHLCGRRRRDAIASRRSVTSIIGENTAAGKPILSVTLRLNKAASGKSRIGKENHWRRRDALRRMCGEEGGVAAQLINKG